MANISRIKLDKTTYEIKDAQAARASDLALKQDALTAGNGIAIDSSDIIRTTGIPFGTCDSTSTSKVFTATVPGIYKLEDGVCCIIKNGVVTSESGFTLNVNGLGAKPSYSNMATGNDVTPTDPTRDTTIFNINYAMLFVYSSTIVDGGGWICYRGYDANTNTIGYQLRHNSSTLPASDKFYRYRLLFTSADGTKYVPANTSSSTNGTASRTVNLRPIDPFGEILYYSSTTAINAGANPAATVLWEEYVLNLGYSFNRTGSALVLTYPKPVYIKCAPQTDGSAIIDADAPYVQNLPSSVDVDHIYIFLGIAYSATNIELLPTHPVYYYDGTGIRIWTGKKMPTKVSELTNDSGFITNSSLNGLASTSYVDTKVAGVVNSAPETLDTLNELATALGNDPNFATTIATQLGNKVDKETGKSLMTDAEHTKLQGIATGAEVNVQADWNQTTTTADDYIKNKPNLATVATSGSYDDLSDKPIYLVTLSIDNNDQLTSDKDYDEISEAIQDGKLVIVEFSQSMTGGLSTKQSFRYSALMSLQDGDVIGFTALGVKYGSSITTLACSKSNTETIWNIGNIIIPAGVRLSGNTYNTNVSDGYIRLDEVLPTVAITGSYNDLTNKPTIPTSADINAAKPFIITITPTYGEPTTYSANKTFAEIISAYDDDRDLLVKCENYYYNLKHVNDDKTLIDFELIDSENRVGQLFTITAQSIAYKELYYQSPLTFDNLPTANSNNPVKSGGVYTALANKADKTVIGTLTGIYDEDDEFIIGYTCDKTFSELYTAFNNGTQVILSETEDINAYFFLTYCSSSDLYFRTLPSSQFSFWLIIDDQNTISYGVYRFQPLLTFDNTPTQNSNNPVKSGGVYSALQGKEDKCLVVTFTENNGVYSADKTLTQIVTAASNGVKVFGVLGYDLYNLVFYEDEAIFQSNFENTFSTLVVGGNYVEYHQGEFVKYKQYSNVTALNADDPATGTIGRIPSTGVFYIYEGRSQGWKKLIVDSDLSSYVPTSRTINGKALTTNITLNASDVGADVFVVYIESDGNDGYTCDKTNAEIYAAWQANRSIICLYEYRVLILYSEVYSHAASFEGLDPENYYGHILIDIYVHDNAQVIDVAYVSYQSYLESGTNIKTINNQSLLGSGNLTASDIGALPSNTHIPSDIKVGSVAGKLYRNNVAGSGNFTVTGNSGCIPNLTAGTFLVSIYAKSTTQSYTFRFNFGSSVTYDLSTTNGEINDVRQITIPSNGTFSGLVLNGSVASGTILYVVMYNYLTPISTVGPAAVTNRYADLDGTPTIPTVNNGTLTIQRNGTTVGTFTANLSSNTTANINVPILTSVTVSGTGAVTQALDSNKFYKFGSLTSLTLTLNAASEGLAIYGGKFTADSSGCTLSIPSTVTAASSVPTILGGSTYEFNIMDNVLLMIEI